MTGRRPSPAEPPVRIVLGPRFEPFYALALLTAPPAPGDARWLATARRRLPRRLARLHAALGGAPRTWIVLADAAGVRPAAEGFPATIAALAALPTEAFARTVLLGQLHHAGAVEALLAEPRDVRGALALVPPAKREWLQHFGLYPLDAAAAGVAALSRLAADPAAAQRTAVEALTLFWERLFRASWERRAGRLRRAAERAANDLAGRPFAAFARAYRLAIEVDPRARALGALRGGYRIGFREIAELRLYPSLFNPERFWTVLEDADRRKVVHVPFPAEPPSIPGGRAAPVDVALAFRALGDATRFAIATLLARRSMSSAEVARALAVSKPTVTHHVHLLREAGLLEETGSGGPVALSLSRRAVAALSSLALARLYGDESPDGGPA